LICDFRLMNVDKQFSCIRIECQKQHIRKARTRFSYVKRQLLSKRENTNNEQLTTKSYSLFSLPRPQLFQAHLPSVGLPPLLQRILQEELQALLLFS